MKKNEEEKSANESSEPKVELTETKTELTENEILRKEIDALKEMFAQLDQKQNVVEKVSKASIEDDEPFIHPDKLIKIVSMVIGGLNLRVEKDRAHVVIDSFGQSTRVSFKDLRLIIDNHRELASNGAFIITDELAIKALYLEEEYEKILKTDKLEAIVDQEPEEIINTLENLTTIQKNTFLQKFVRGIASGDKRYGDLNKIRSISNYIGQDLEELSKELV